MTVPGNDNEQGQESRSQTDVAEDLSPAQAAAAAVRHTADLIGNEVLGTVSVEPSEDGWVVGIEVLEEKRVPSSSDMLALYEIEVDEAGNVFSYKRIRRYLRGKPNGNGLNGGP
jgi:uncharacterized protein YuzE